MSLLDMNVSKKNRQFLVKMNNQFQRRSSSLSTNKKSILNDQHYVNPIKVQNDKIIQGWTDAQTNIINLMKNFTFDLTKILQNLKQTTKFYKLLKFMKQNQFFWEVSSKLNDKILKENEKLKLQIIQIKKFQSSISKVDELSSKQVIQKNKYNKKSEQKLQNMKINQWKSLPQNIYFQAKALNESQFIIWCDQLLMKDKIIIKNIKTNQQLQAQYQKGLHKSHYISRQQLHKMQDINEKDPKYIQSLTKITQRLKNIIFPIDKSLFQKQKQLLINEIKDYSIIKFTCNNLCCNFVQPNAKFRQSMTQFLSKQNKKSDRDVYHTRNQQQYFNRYYKNDCFQVENVKSVQHTKYEEMQRLEKKYLKMAELRNKNRYHVS